MLDLDSLRGTHDGDNVFLVGNGERIANLRNPSFGVNLINRIYPDTSWRPWYYVCTDKYVLDNFEDEVRTNIDAARVAFVPSTDMDKYGGDNVVPLIVKDYQSDLPLTEGVYSYGTTLFIALQIANHMGYKQATFIGCDLYFGERMHFYDNDPMVLTAKELSRRRSRSVLAHAKMIQYADRHGMKVVYE